ncbi:MAG: amino acid permease [Caldisericaceae bacterium]|nr:amino acid permease [Caldisericaceae bacterium]
MDFKNLLAGVLKNLKGASPKKQQKLGVFGGVFTPDVLTILGVIMYLRLGWVVGNAGLLGAVAIILLSKTITTCTALSMSSITTNIKIGAGGAYSIISKSLGLEAGGSIGIPFYISQMLSVALYIVGFTEGWLRIFPEHNPLLVSTIIWMVLLIIISISTHFAIKTQYFILGIIALSLISFYSTPAPVQSSIPLIGKFEDGNFWYVFSIFFPAATGIMAGANLSGDLKDPRRAIPLGTLSAIGVTMVVYLTLAYTAARHIPIEELRTNQMVMVDHARWGWLVLMGILAATFSSALGSFLGAPRILQALAEHKTIPFATFFAKKSPTNEPLNAFIFTAILVELALLLGNLNALASLITMFFLITYGMINLVVFIQQKMHIISFRPTFKVPSFVPFIGALGSLFVMFLINPVFSGVAITTIIVLYIWLGKRGLRAEWGDIRGGMFLMLAEKAAQIAQRFPRHQVSWKPDLLIPVDDPKVWAGPLLFIKNIVHPSGSVFAFTVTPKKVTETEEELKRLFTPIANEQILVHTTAIQDNDFLHGALLVIQTLKAYSMRPNTLFLTLGNKPAKDHIIETLSSYARDHQLGLMILRQHQRIAFGLQQNINLWLRDQSPNWHLAILISLQLQHNWGGKLNLITATTEPAKKQKLLHFLEKLSDRARLPSMTEFYVLEGEFKKVMSKAPAADINIFGLAQTLPFDFMRKAPELVNSSCIFIRDSGLENAMV